MFLAKEVVTWLDIIRQVKRQVHDLTEENGDWRAEKSTRDSIYKAFGAHLITHSIQKREEQQQQQILKNEREKGVLVEFQELTKKCQLSKDGHRVEK